MVVRMRNNRSQSKQRRSHHGLKNPTVAVCSNCAAQHRPHNMCLDCGFYNGRQVLDLAAEKNKREARLLAKKEAIKGQQNTADTEADSLVDSIVEPEVEVLPAAKETTKDTPAAKK